MIIVNNIKHVLEQDKFSGFELMLFLLSGGFGGGKQVIVEPHRHEGKPLEHLHHFRVPHRPHVHIGDKPSSACGCDRWFSQGYPVKPNLLIGLSHMSINNLERNVKLYQNK